MGVSRNNVMSKLHKSDVFEAYIYERSTKISLGFYTSLEFARAACKARSRLAEGRLEKKLKGGIYDASYLHRKYAEDKSGAAIVEHRKIKGASQ